MFNKELPYITRNTARGILTDLAYYNTIPSTSIHDLCAYAILYFQKKYNLSYVTFVFTNALIDMFPDTDVNDENIVHTMTALKKVSVDDTDIFFMKHSGFKLENMINRLSESDNEYHIDLKDFGQPSYNPEWFNNSDQYIYPLLSAYQDFKKERTMLFQKDDIKQIPIDYSVILCFNHYSQRGFLNKFICTAIIKTLTNAANQCLNSGDLNDSSIAFEVFTDLANPKSIKCAFEFIKQL